MQNRDLKAKIMNACGYENFSDSIPEYDGPQIKAIKVNHDSNANN